MSGKKAFEAQIAALDALRQAPAEDRTGALRKALGNRNNFIVGKAADLAREFELAELTPDLVTAFDRFFENAEKSDPQCWAKNAISKALAAFEYQEAETFLRGMRHVQLEPVYGGRSDSAATLRSTCAFALVQCRGVREEDLLAHLIELMPDKDQTVRAEVMRAIEQVGSTAAALLLRARAVIAKDEPEVLGACYGGVLRIEGVRAIPWVSRFMAAGDDAATEAALAISATHSREGFEALKERLETARDPAFRSVLLAAIGLTRQDAAVEFLLDLIREGSMDAAAAIDAVMRALPPEDVVKQVEAMVAGNARLERVLAEQKSGRN